MAERRALIEGLKPTPPVETHIEKAFVFGEKTAKPGEPTPHAAMLSNATTSNPTSANATPIQSRSPISTRIRSDFATALKRASLERQLAGTNPHTVQDILEEALEPWLRTNGYLA